MHLRARMRACGVAVYLVPSSDYHASEYLAAHFRLRAFVSGFTGSSGLLVVAREQAALFTDSRYFLQAEAELLNSGIDLVRMGEAGAPSLERYVLERIGQGGVLGFDGRVVDTNTACALLEAVEKQGGSIDCELDLAGDIFEARPPLPCEPVFLLQERYAGLSAGEKLRALRAAMRAYGAHAFVVTALDEIAWLFNIRGGDIAYNPLALCYAVIEEAAAYWFIDAQKLPADVKAQCEALRVCVRPYEQVYGFVEAYSEDTCVLMCKAQLNYALYRRLANARLVDAASPLMLAKAVKNPVEQANMRAAHRKDGVAFVQFLHWLKTTLREAPVTEAEAAQKLDLLRLEQIGCVGKSFETISAYGPHAAIVHYVVTPQTDIALARSGFYLVDSGGHYYEGTTDITRTVALGALTQAQRTHFTLVLKGMLHLLHMQFPAGCTGAQLDIPAREALWAHGLDYGHGTGHGVGYMLPVHEPPVTIGYKKQSGAIVPGMVVSNEPGLYLPGQYGIRIENQMLCVPKEETAYGAFYGFESLTLAPIERCAVDKAVLGEPCISALNAYHERVYAALAPFLDDATRAFLWEETRPL